MTREFSFHQKKVVGFSVKAVVTHHIKISFRYMDNYSFDEFKNGDSFLNILFVLMPVVTKGNGIAFVFENTFLGDDRPADIAYHVIYDVFIIGQFCVSVNIKTIVLGLIQLVNDRIEALGINSGF